MLSKLTRIALIGAVLFVMIFAAVQRLNAVPETQYDTFKVHAVQSQCDGLYVVLLEGQVKTNEMYVPYLTYETATANALQAHLVSGQPFHMFYREVMWSDKEYNYQYPFKGYKILELHTEDGDEM